MAVNMCKKQTIGDAMGNRKWQLTFNSFHLIFICLSSRYESVAIIPLGFGSCFFISMQIKDKENINVISKVLAKSLCST